MTIANRSSVGVTKNREPCMNFILRGKDSASAESPEALFAPDLTIAIRAGRGRAQCLNLWYANDEAWPHADALRLIVVLRPGGPAFPIRPACSQHVFLRMCDSARSLVGSVSRRCAMLPQWGKRAGIDGCE
jgi:hypothetical protein